jgi:hypothetical protein
MLPGCQSTLRVDGGGSKDGTRGRVSLPSMAETRIDPGRQGPRFRSDNARQAGVLLATGPVESKAATFGWRPTLNTGA